MKLKGADAEHEQHEALVQHYQVRTHGATFLPCLHPKSENIGLVCYLVDIFREFA